MKVFVFSSLDFVWKYIHDSYYRNSHRKEKAVFRLRQWLSNNFYTRTKVVNPVSVQCSGLT